MGPRAGRFVGFVYCPQCGKDVRLEAGVALGGVSRDGSLLRVQTTDATGRHRCGGGQ